MKNNKGKIIYLVGDKVLIKNESEDIKDNHPHSFDKGLGNSEGIIVGVLSYRCRDLYEIEITKPNNTGKSGWKGDTWLYFGDQIKCLKERMQ